MTDKKLDIVASTIEQDQQTVASQWANTFLHNHPTDVGTQIMQLLSACVAAGDFKTRSAFSSSEELQAPNDQLTIADYLSHASRIILDYQELSETHRAELLSYFPDADSVNSVFSRSATHNVYRSENTIVEGKGLIIGLRGQLPAMLNTPRDFGVNIAMGGEGKQNFYGKTISTNGFSGHVYFHKNTPDNLLMVGLEQSAPAASILELFTGHQTYSEAEQQNNDQFGQGHSLTGASDVYTAAASLYFSDPVYQAKLILEKGYFPPEKYGAMQVTLTDDNWPAIKSFLDALKQAAAKKSEAELLGHLLKKPATASSQKQECVSYIALDFKTYLQRVYTAFIKNSSLVLAQQQDFQLLQNNLLELIKKLQKGEVDSYEDFINLIEQITTTELIPTQYKEAIARIDELFKLQLDLDNGLNATHQELMLKARYEELQEDRNELVQKMVAIKQYFESDYINKDPGLSNFLLELERQLSVLLQPQDSLSVTENDLGQSVIVVNPVVGVSAEKVRELDQQINQCRILLSQAPKLHSQAAMDEQQELLRQEKDSKQQLEQELANYKVVAEAAKQQLQLEHLEAQQRLADEHLLAQQRLQAEIQEAQLRYEQLLKQGKLTQARMARIAPILNDIDSLVELKQSFVKKKLKNVELEADQLISALQDIIDQYCNNPTEDEEEALADFKNECMHELLKPREELDKHESFRRIISNILLAISLLIVGYIVAAGVNRLTTGRYTFFENDAASTMRKNVAGLTIKPEPQAGQEQEQDQEPGIDSSIQPVK
ncbi:MAG: hypothetical protein P4L79_05370 [Legionella sp.]|uniref:hypothetical protein n=1 Tax=Legionella sp. TaxID=459 RepID=UPI0028468822|nr:hypothetical protein [Legionella sp.]